MLEEGYLRQGTAAPFLLNYILMRKSTWERTVLLNVRRSARIY